MDALVAYSDSEGSDTEVPAPAPPPKPAFSKSKEPRKIQVNLPSTVPEPQADEGAGAAEPPAKRARTAGAFGGFNSLLPAPKRAAPAPQLKKGVNLKTSSEAAFSRAPAEPAPANETTDTRDNGDDEYDEFGNKKAAAPAQEKKDGGEVKIIGKATKFRPLSVANNKKKKPVARRPSDSPAPVAKEAPKPEAPVAAAPVKEPAPPAAKPKKSLFSTTVDEPEVPEELHADLEPPRDVRAAAPTSYDQPPPTAAQTQPAPTTSNSLESIASDLNLTSAQRRHIFGRSSGKNAAANITHFNMDNEYAANEEIRQSGETIEHKAVKAVAPGKHSLQQLVNNARSNQESMEDKWAEGRRQQGGGNYGWGGAK